jgi:hypothetical protein
LSLFKSDLKIIEIAAAISENYPLSEQYLENEILTVKNKNFLKTHAVQDSRWKLLPRHNFGNLKRFSEIVHCSFGSPYLCNLRFLT